MTVLIRGTRVFDGHKVQDVTDVLIEGGLIAAVGSDLRALGSVPVVEAAAQTLLPGLIDSHVHIGGMPWAERHLRQALAAGVTTVVSMNDDPAMVKTLKAEAAGSADLADLRSAGWCATVPGGHPTQWGEHPTLEHPGEAPAYVGDRLREGSDFLKVIIENNVGRPCPQVPPELSTALAEEARRRGLLSVAHVSSLAHAEQALGSGIDGLAHQFGDQELTADFARQLAESETFVIMTLNCVFGAEGAELAVEPRIGPYMDPDFHRHLAEARMEHIGVASDPGPRGVRVLQAVGRLREAGADILAGTDAAGIGAVGPSLHHELTLLVRGGLTATEALTAATSIPARRFSLPDRGRIESGCRADLLLVDGDPTTDINATRAIARIWRGGVEFDREAYRLAVNSDDQPGGIGTG